MKHVLLDTNVILRFLRRDDSEQSPQAAALFDAATNGDCTLRIGWHVVAECVWALRHHYDASREGIATSLSTMITSEAIVCDGKPMMLNALERYRSSKLDIVDCMLASESAGKDETLATFDHGISKEANGISLWDWKG